MTSAPVTGTIFNLQAVRALAALLVVYLHYSLSPKVNLTPFFGTFGVEIFFVVSGFIISHVAGESVSDFAAKRLIRIAPIYWLVTIFWICAVTVAPSLGHTPVTFETVVRSFLFIIPEPIVLRGWTLSYEMYFYAVFTLCLWLSRKHVRLLSSAIISVVFLIIYVAAPKSPDIRFYGHPLVFDFVLGMFAHFIWMSIGKSDRAAQLVRQARTGILAFVLLSFVICILSEANIGFLAGTTRVPWIFCLVLGAVTIEAYGDFTLRSRIVKLLGDASYVIYLIHPFLLSLLKLFLPRGFPESSAITKFVVFLLFASVICAVSYVVHILLEKPMNKYLLARYRQALATRRAKLAIANATT